MLDNAKKSMNVQDRMVPCLERIVEAEEIDPSGHARSMKSMWITYYVHLRKLRGSVHNSS